MKDINEVDVASDLAARFVQIDFDKNLNTALDEILTPVEKEIVIQLLDREQGPFAEIWSSGDYRWDGKAEADNFWSLVRRKM